MAGGGRDAAVVEAATDHPGGALAGRAGRRHLHAHGAGSLPVARTLMVADDAAPGIQRLHLDCIDGPALRVSSALIAPWRASVDPLQGLATPGAASVLVPVVHMDCCSAVA
jgi:hypothetical protein